MKRFQTDWVFDHNVASANLGSVGIVPRKLQKAGNHKALCSYFGSDYGVVQASCPRCGAAIQVGGGDAYIEYVSDHCYVCLTQISRSLSVLEGLLRGALTHEALVSYLREDWLTELSEILESEGEAALVLGPEQLRERTRRALRGIVL